MRITPIREKLEITKTQKIKRLIQRESELRLIADFNLGHKTTNINPVDNWPTFGHFASASIV